MSDIDTVWSNIAGRGDYVLAGADLQAGDDLMTAVLISLFTDRTAAPSDVLPDASTDRRGWWGDAGETYPIGSRLWLLERAKLTLTNTVQGQATALAAKNYSAEALQWMIDDGVVAEFDLATQIKLPNQLWLTITAYRTRGNKTAKNFAWTLAGPVIYTST